MQLGQDAAERGGCGAGRAEREVGVAEEGEEAVVARGLGGLRRDGFKGRAEGVLCGFDGGEIAGGKEGDDDRAERCDIALGDEDWLAQDVGVDLVQLGVLLGDAAAVDDAADGHAVLFHAVEDDAGVQGGALDGGEELIGCGVVEVPAEGDAAEGWVDQDGAVAVVPGEAEEAGLAGLEAGGGFAERGDGGFRRGGRWRSRWQRTSKQYSVVSFQY